MARRRLNKNVVLILFLVGAAMLVGISVVMLQSLQATDPARFATMAEAAEQEENWELAVLFYYKAWERSNDASYLVKRGNAAMEWGELGLAMDTWQKAVIADPSLTDARMSELELQFELAKLYRDLQYWLNVEDRVNSLFASGIDISSDRLAFVNHALGLALVNLKSQDEDNPRKGLAAMQKSVTLDPDNVEYAISLARQYMSVQEQEKAQQLLDSLVQKYATPSADASKCHLAYAEFLMATRRFEEAEPYFVKATELAGEDVESLREARVGHATYISQRWSLAVRRDGRSDEVDAILDQSKAILIKAVEDEPDSFAPYLRLAFIMERLLGEHEETVEICEQRLSREFSRKGIEAARNRFNVFLLNVWASEACVALANDKKDEKEEWIAKAEQYLADARGEAPSHPLAFHQEGRIRLAQGRDRAALEAMRKADARYKSANRVDWELKTALANLHIRLKQPGAALELFEDVMELAQAQRGSDAIYWVLYAQALTETGQYRKAAAVLDPILMRRPTLKPALELKAAVLERMGQHKLAGEVMPSNSTSAILRAKESLLRNDRDTALQVLKDAHAETPDDFRLTGALVAQLVRQDDYKGAEEVIATAKKANPDSPRISALGIWVDRSLSEEQRDAKLLSIIESEENEFQRMLDLLDYYQSRDQESEALVSLDRAIELAQETTADATMRSSLRSLLRLKLDIGWRLKDKEVMQAARDLAAEMDVDGASGKTFAGLYHMLWREWTLAADMFRGALDIQGTDAESMGHLGECLLMMERTDDARKYMERAVRINPNLAIAHRGLARLAKLRGDRAALERHLTECERLIPSDKWVRAERFLLEERSSPVEAIAKRERLYEKSPDDMANLRRLAALCATEGLRDKADKYYKELIDKNPDDRQLVMIVSSYYRQTERPDKALALVQDFKESRDSTDDAAEAAILMALHYVNTRAYDDAEAVLLAASDANLTLNLARSLGEFYQQYAGKPQEAIQWYQKAASLAEAEEPETVATMLENEIRCYLERDLNDLDAASQKIAALRSRFPDSARAFLLNSELNARRGKVDAAINDLSDYLNAAPTDTVARFLRAKHYVALGQVGAAIKDLETIRQRAPLALDLRPRLLLAGLHQ
ncbi:MAG: tetratricopeptide repeat protein, partial [Phycisphaerae bacterium]